MSAPKPQQHVKTELDEVLSPDQPREAQVAALLLRSMKIEDWDPRYAVHGN